MIKLSKYLVLFIVFQTSVRTLFAQDLVALKPEVTIEELNLRVNTLIGAMNEGNKILLEREAAALANSDKEVHLNLAATVYERALGHPRRAKEVRDQLFARFPKGQTARAYAHAVIFRNQDLSIVELEKEYQLWLDKFPSKNFGEQEQDLYTISEMYLAERYAKAGMVEKMKASIAHTKKTDYYVEGVTKSYKALDRKYKQTFFYELEEAYKYSSILIDKDKGGRQQAINKRQFVALSIILAKELLEKEQFDRAIAVISKPLVEVSDEQETALEKTLIIGEVYAKTGKEKEALAIYESFLSKHGQERQVLDNARIVYQKIGKGTIGFEEYITALLLQSDKALYEKYKAEMIKQPAADFTLVDTNGKSVTLSDYKGKVVILDFWATWCVPCIQSFPGMQAAVSKYKSDSEVVFLFINTWQREENYEDVVKKFLKDNPYTFHVLFDEMRDAPKSVATAYKLRGIPTKVIIDREGYIRFNSAGSETNIDKLVKELDVKIGLAKSKYAND